MAANPVVGRRAPPLGLGSISLSNSLCVGRNVRNVGRNLRSEERNLHNVGRTKRTLERILEDSLPSCGIFVSLHPGLYLCALV